LFPNSVQPVHGNFVLERMRHLTPFIDMSVVAPVPYFPRMNVKNRWSKFGLVPGTEHVADFNVQHPRYVVIPKVGMVTHGISMFAGSFRQVSEYLNAAEYDLIDAHYVYPDGFAAIALGAVFKKPVVVSARGSDINLFSQFTIIRPMLKHVLKRAMTGILPDEILYRSKRGFGAPMGAWLKQSLAGMTDALLSKEVVGRRGLFHHETVQALIDAHKGNLDDHTDHLQALTNLEIFSRVFIDGRSVDDVTIELKELSAQ